MFEPQKQTNAASSLEESKKQKHQNKYIKLDQNPDQIERKNKGTEIQRFVLHLDNCQWEMNDGEKRDIPKPKTQTSNRS